MRLLKQGGKIEDRAANLEIQIKDACCKPLVMCPRGCTGRRGGIPSSTEGEKRRFCRSQILTQPKGGAITVFQLRRFLWTHRHPRNRSTSSREPKMTGSNCRTQVLAQQPSWLHSRSTITSTVTQCALRTHRPPRFAFFLLAAAPSAALGGARPSPAPDRSAVTCRRVEKSWNGGGGGSGSIYILPLCLFYQGCAARLVALAAAGVILHG